MVATLFGFVQVRSPLDRGFTRAALVIGEDSGVVVKVVLPVLELFRYLPLSRP
jgi:hypothetical protein